MMIATEGPTIDYGKAASHRVKLKKTENQVFLNNFYKMKVVNIA